MAYGKSNNHVTDDITWLWKVELVTPIRLEPIPRKRLEIETPFQRTTNSKGPTGNRIVTWPMTSRDLDRSSRDLNTLKAQYLENSCRCHLATITNYSLLWGSTVCYPSDGLASCYVLVTRCRRSLQSADWHASKLTVIVIRYTILYDMKV